MLGSFHLGIFDAERAYMTGPVQKDFDCRLFAQIVRLNMEGIWLSVWMARTAKENARGSSDQPQFAAKKPHPITQSLVQTEL